MVAVPLGSIGPEWSVLTSKTWPVSQPLPLTYLLLLLLLLLLLTTTTTTYYYYYYYYDYYPTQ